MVITHQLCPHFQANLNIHMHVFIGRVALRVCPVPPPCASVPCPLTCLMHSADETACPISALSRHGLMCKQVKVMALTVAAILLSLMHGTLYFHFIMYMRQITELLSRHNL